MVRISHPLIVIVLVLLAVLSGEARASDDPKPRLAVPDAASAGRAGGVIHDLFKAEYAQGAGGRLALARKLMTEAQKADPAADPPGAYALLNEARRAAVAGGDFGLAAAAVDRTAALFDVAGGELKASLLAAAKQARSPSAAASAVPVAMDLAMASELADDYKSAEQWCVVAQELADRSGDGWLVGVARAWASKTRAEAAAFTRVKAAAEKLKQAPDDPAANLAVGTWLCFDKGKWDDGIPHLLKGSDAKLVALASSEADKSALKPADAWYDYSRQKGLTAATRAGALNRAAHWYTQAQPALVGIQARLAEQRIAEAAHAGGANGGVYLSELKEVKADGIMRIFDWGVGRDMLNRGGSPLVVNGVTHAHGICFNPDDNANAHVDYSLGRRYRRFTGSVALDDTAKGVSSTLTFKIVGDGREIWKSQPIRSTGTIEPFDVSIMGVDSLQIQVQNAGSSHDAHAVWLDAHLDSL